MDDDCEKYKKKLREADERLNALASQVEQLNMPVAASATVSSEQLHGLPDSEVEEILKAIRSIQSVVKYER